MTENRRTVRACL